MPRLRSDFMKLAHYHKRYEVMNTLINRLSTVAFFFYVQTVIQCLRL